jgi:hypothetical protein
MRKGGTVGSVPLLLLLMVLVLMKEGTSHIVGIVLHAPVVVEFRRGRRTVVCVNWKHSLLIVNASDAGRRLALVFAVEL